MSRGETLITSNYNIFVGWLLECGEGIQFLKKSQYPLIDEIHTTLEELVNFSLMMSIDATNQNLF